MSYSQEYIFRNPTMSAEERAKDLVSHLTLDEKASLMLDESQAVPRLGINSFNWWSEALHGIANNNGVTVFPEPIGMAASFNDTLLQQIYTAVSDEMRALYNDNRRSGNKDKKYTSLSVWTPNVNIFRDPRWGRGQETYGEDPYLTSMMGIAVVRGLQGPDNAKYRKLYACAKHFAVHSGPEWSRHVANLNDVSPRDLWGTYLPAFKALVQQAGVKEVMCAYQRLDDEPCCGNTRLLQQILRDEWGFKGMVVSDCGAVSDLWQNHKVSSDATHASAKAMLAGTDVECGFDYAYKSVPDAVRRGLISEHDVDLHVFRAMKGRFELGEMDDPSIVPWSKLTRKNDIDTKAHQQLALEIARQSMTLLQNKNEILPLPKNIKIAVMGPNANDEQLMWGNYNGTPSSTVTILEGIKQKITEHNIVYMQGCDIVDDKILENYLPKCNIDGKKGLSALYWNNPEQKGDAITTSQYTEPLNLTTTGQHQFAKDVKLKGFSAIYHTIFDASKTEDLMFKVSYIGNYILKINDDTIRHNNSWSHAISKIPYHVEAGKKYDIKLIFIQQNDFADANLGFSFGKEKNVDYGDIVKRLKGVDLVIFCGGISSQLEGEEMPIELPGFKGGDRTDIELPSSQRNCIQALKDAGKKIILVNCSGSCMGLEPETKNCDAILQAWYAGEKGGQAIADVLFGDYNPSGKLPITFYKSIKQIPDFENYSMKGRTYRYMTETPLFPFGYGLSYTTFKIDDAKTDKTVINKKENLKLTIPISNTGKLNGVEILQVYVHKLDDTNATIKSLRAFRRVTLNAGSTENVTFDLPSSTFECFDEGSNTMRVTSGNYELYYGTSSANCDLKKINITIKDEE
ncbi:MAG: glycoside hydrolase family 3 C-terminal domain-containing protein [Prevotella sp.]|nr:glycoside hydrolase family 3 C-terminal domain-containing protein [Prevotella sp.]MCI1281917.1 glycoside hydrolase family 3 C-terminal domain-containing protein [Prevotella sp.]